MSVCRPRMHKKEGESFNDRIVEGNAQMIISLLKQRYGPANKKYWVYFDRVYNILNDLEKKDARDEDDAGRVTAEAFWW